MFMACSSSILQIFLHQCYMCTLFRRSFGWHIGLNEEQHSCKIAIYDAHNMATYQFSKIYRYQAIAFLMDFRKGFRFCQEQHCIGSKSISTVAVIVDKDKSLYVHVAAIENNDNKTPPINSHHPFLHTLMTLNELHAQYSAYHSFIPICIILSTCEQGQVRTYPHKQRP